jgi:hypothetical protein
VFDRRDCDLLLQADTAVAAAGAVNLNAAHMTFIGSFGAGDTDGTAGNSQDVARSRLHSSQIARGHSCDGEADVFDTRFRYAQCENYCRGGWDHFRH